MIVPILKIGKNMVTSLPTSLTDQEARKFQTELLEEVARTEASGIVIDITAMDVVDSYMSRILNETVTNVGLMGTQAVIVGIRPEVAMTLILMGRRLVGAETALNLEQGLAKLDKMQDRK